MICAGWIRFRASLMAMRRTSWIDQRINDDVAMRWFLPWFGASFFLTAADWRDDGSPLAPGLKHMRAADPEYIAFACPTQLLLDIANTVDGVTSNPFEWYRRGHGGCDHSRRELWFGRKADIGGHVCGFQAIRIVGPFLRKIQRTVDERMTVARNVGSEDPDLAVRDLACGAGILPRHSARRLALLEKAGLVDHEDRIVIRQMLDDIIAYDIAQGIRIPIHAAQDRLLPPGAGIASRLGAHPTSLALLISEQAFQEQAGIRRNALLSEQRTYPLLDLPKRRRPQRKRLLNRRCPRPRSSNHGCPWIQKPVKKATVMLGQRLQQAARPGFCRPGAQRGESAWLLRWPCGKRGATPQNVTVQPGFDQAMSSGGRPRQTLDDGAPPDAAP